MLRAVVPLALLLVAAAPKGAARRAHPERPNASPEACIDCHAEVTPAVVEQWQSGPHGLLLVKCFVCHGTTGADFRRSPDVVQCRGCHAGKAAPASGRRASQACFGCHAPHTLAAGEGKQSPHASKAPGATP